MSLKINFIFLQLILLFFVGIEIEGMKNHGLHLLNPNHNLEQMQHENSLPRVARRELDFKKQAGERKVGDKKDHSFNEKSKQEDEEKYERIILASNAPPIHLQEEKGAFNAHNKEDFEERRLKTIEKYDETKLEKKESNWEISQASGGLVSAVMPMMKKSNSKNKNIWVFHVTLSDEQRYTKDNDPKLKKLKKYMDDAFELSPVLIDSTTYSFYYKEISNSILWPALHNIPKNISEYSNNEKNDYLNEYKKVNELFADKIMSIESKKNDFIWIQDYQLLLVGKYLREKEENTKPMKLGFFLHTPFELFGTKFVDNFNEFTEEILKGILSFNKVGFQTNKDRQNFINLFMKSFKNFDYNIEKKGNIIKINIGNITPKDGCFLGVYPATINIDEFKEFDEKDKKEAEKFKKGVLENSLAEGKLFFSVERFDYTKGIEERILAYAQYLKDNPDRVGRDVFYQLAPLNRQSIKSYKTYQTKCQNLIDEINKHFGKNFQRKDGQQIKEGYKAIALRTNPLTRDELKLRYLAMDVGIVTPIKDGMNLVAKEMMVANPKASIILSKGVGTHYQLSENGLKDNYFLVLL